jgi:Enolase, C-terminal TIM barrel domain
MVNILSGNLHAAGGMGIQDVLVIPAGAGSTGEALEWVHDVCHATGDLLRARGASVLVGDEGGYGAPAPSAGRRAPDEVGIALDVAATHLIRAHGSYDLDGCSYTREELAGLLAGWAEAFPVLSVEDPFGEDDWVAWQDFARRCPGVQLVGDDLIATHLDRLHRAARRRGHHRADQGQPDRHRDRGAEGGGRGGQAGDARGDLGAVRGDRGRLARRPRGGVGSGPDQGRLGGPLGAAGQVQPAAPDRTLGAGAALCGDVRAATVQRER